eukprot:14013419-Alexandrium_andersonii.AAC.1
MSASLVGSEMCIRDRGAPPRPPRLRAAKRGQASPGLPDRPRAPAGSPSGSGPEVVSNRT